jgi:hypothetical protein
MDNSILGVIREKKLLLDKYQKNEAKKIKIKLERKQNG